MKLWRWLKCLAITELSRWVAPRWKDPGLPWLRGPNSDAYDVRVHSRETYDGPVRCGKCHHPLVWEQVSRYGCAIARYRDCRYCEPVRVQDMS